MYEGFTREFRFRHCVVASTWAFEAQGPGSIPGGGAREATRSKGGGAREATRSKGGGAREATRSKGGGASNNSFAPRFSYTFWLPDRLTPVQPPPLLDEVT